MLQPVEPVFDEKNLALAGLEKYWATENAGVDLDYDEFLHVLPVRKPLFDGVYLGLNMPQLEAQVQFEEPPVTNTRLH